MSTISLVNIWQASVYNIPKKFDCKWYLEQRFNTTTKLRPTEKSLRQRTLSLLNSKLDIYMFITVGWLSLVQWPTIQSNMILCPSALGMAQLWCKDIIFRQMYLLYIKLLTTSQGCHSWQGPQGLGLTWILQNRKCRWQRQHAADVANTVAALPAKHWPWRPCLYWFYTGKTAVCHRTTTSTF